MPNAAYRSLLFASLMFCSLLSVAQDNPASSAPSQTAAEVGVEANQPDPQIVRALKEISPQQIQATIDKLVTFKNRNTLSSNDQQMISQGLGAAAAAKWIQEEFERYAQACGGCLQVKTDSFTQPVAPRVPAPTPLTNVSGAWAFNPQEPPKPQ